MVVAMVVAMEVSMQLLVQLPLVSAILVSGMGVDTEVWSLLLVLLDMAPMAVAKVEVVVSRKVGGQAVAMLVQEGLACSGKLRKDQGNVVSEINVMTVTQGAGDSKMTAAGRPSTTTTIGDPGPRRRPKQLSMRWVTGEVRMLPGPGADTRGLGMVHLRAQCRHGRLQGRQPQQRLVPILRATMSHRKIIFTTSKRNRQIMFNNSNQSSSSNRSSSSSSNINSNHSRINNNNNSSNSRNRNCSHLFSINTCSSNSFYSNSSSNSSCNSSSSNNICCISNKHHSFRCGNRINRMIRHNIKICSNSNSNRSVDKSSSLSNLLCNPA